MDLKHDTVGRTHSSWRWTQFVAATLCVWLVSSSWAEDAADAVDLRPNWTAGQAATYSFTNFRSSASTLKLPDQEIEADFEIRSEGEVRWVVDRVLDDGSARCTMTLEWMTVTLTTPDGQTMTNDSRKSSGDEPTMHKIGRAMAGRALTVDVAADGSVRGVDGLRAMRDAVDDPDLLPDETDFIETATELATLAFAPEASAVGDRWNAGFTWNFGIVGMEIGSIEQDWTYTLEAVETIEGVRIAVVRGECRRMKMDDSAVQEQKPEGAPDIRLRLTESEATTQVLFDLSRHEAVGRQATMSTTLKITIPLPNGQTIERTVTETMQGSTLRIAED